MQTLLERYGKVCAQVEAACREAGRDRSEVLLLAVSKFQPAEAIATLARAGQADFGENYVQEAWSKRETLVAENECASLRWHMIGHVQSRKARLVAGSFTLLHSLDSQKLASALERDLAAENAAANVAQDALIEVNIGEEQQKAGVMPADLPRLAEYVIEQCPHLRLRGLMCLPPVFDSGDAARPYFAKLRKLRDNLQKQTGVALPELSMGMSGDFAAAIAEGSTIVRIGTSIFGPRPARPRA